MPMLLLLPILQPRSSPLPTMCYFQPECFLTLVTASYNMQQEPALAIANLATATASGRSTVASLTAIISNLSQHQINAGQCQTCSHHRRARLLENRHGISSHRYCANVYQAQVNCSSCPQHQLLLDSWLSCQQHPHQAVPLVPALTKDTRRQPLAPTPWAAPLEPRTPDGNGVMVPS